MSKKLKDLTGQLEAKAADANKMIEAAKTDGPELNMDANQVDKLRALNEEMSDLRGQIESAEADAKVIESAASNAAYAASLSEPQRGAIHPTGGSQARQQGPAKSVGELFVASEAYKGHKPGSRSGGTMSTLDVGLQEMRATLFETGAGWAPESTRTGVVVPKALRPLQLIDIIPEGATGDAAVVYIEETTATPAAAERSEGGPYAESALAFTERSVTVRSIGTSLPVTDEQLEDVAQARSYIDGRLGFFVMQRLDGQILNGDGNAPNLTGLLNASGLQTQAKGVDPVPDAVYKAMTKVRVTGRAFPSAVVSHPNDWQDVRLLRTTDGVYIWGNPSESGPEMIWGLRVIQSDAIAENTMLVGDFSPAMLQLYIRRGLEVQLGYVNDDFLDGRQTVRAGLRCALVTYRGSAFCTVTSV